MKLTTSVVTLALVGATFALPASAADEHNIFTPQDVEWSSGPASLPEGAEMAVLFGDPSKDGLFAMRLKMPDGYRIAPHSHPRPEVVTVISGTFRVGMGETAEDAGAKALPAGSFFAFEPGMNHYASTDGETVVQLNSTGPWAIDYVDPKEDPRKKAQ